jgi:putative membrane protein
VSTIESETSEIPSRTDRVRDLGGVVAGGVFMGAAEIVPGVSGGTIALVFGIYDRLITVLSDGAAALGHLVRGDVAGGLERLRKVEWPFVVSLLAGMGTAIAVLSSILHGLLETQAVALSALFMGLVAGSVVLGRRELHAPLSRGELGVAAGVAIVTFVGLGLTPGRVSDPALPLFFVAAAVAICAMVLPGISGSFILLLVGMYEPVLAAASDRDLLPLLVFAAGAALGLGLFSSFLHRTLERAHDRTLAVLLGLMAGSLRVLWPWPSGAEGEGDARLGAPVAGEVGQAVLMALVGVAVVVGIAWVGDRTVGDDDPDEAHR